MSTLKTFRRWIVYRLALSGLYLAGRLDITKGLRLGAVLGRLAYYLVRGEREKACSGLQTAFPEKSGEELRRIAKKSFENLGKSFFEFVYYSQRPQLPLDDLVETEGFELFDQALSQGKGVIAVTAHIGNWELLAMYIARRHPVSAVARKVNNEGVNRLMVEFHQKNGIETILRQKGWGTQKRILQTLYDNRLLAVLIDQDARVPGVFVDFFGKPARTPSGPVAIALSTDAPVLFGFIARGDNDRHRITIKEVPMKKVGGKQENIIHNTWVLTRMVEEAIRQNPEQWVWMHRRWKRQPEDNQHSYPSQVEPPPPL